MRHLRNHYSKLLFLLIGGIGGFFISRLPLQFEEKTNWVSLASFFLTIVLAIYLEFVVRPSFSNNRNEKDILIEILKDIKNSISAVQDYYTTAKSNIPLTNENKKEIVSRLRVVSNTIDLLKHTDEYCGTTNKTDLSDNLFKIYLVYKKALTGYKFQQATFSYDRLYWGKNDQAYTKFVKELMHAIIDVNKS